MVGISKALEWTYSAELIPAEEALRCNLVSEVVTPEMLLERVYALARTIANERSTGEIQKPGAQFCLYSGLRLNGQAAGDVIFTGIWP